MRINNTPYCLAACLGMAAWFMPPPALADNAAKVLRMTFGARGEASTVETVTVENLSNGQSVTLEGRDTLLLKQGFIPSDIHSTLAPTLGDLKIVGSQLMVSTSQPTDVDIRVYSADGRCLWQTRQHTGSTASAISLPTLTRGVYIMKASAPGFERSIKWIHAGSLSFPTPTLAGNTGSISSKALTPAMRQPLSQPLDADKPRNVELGYEVGDVLRFTGTSGQMRTITMNSPRTSHPIYFDFFRCEDANGHNYTIVRAGDMMWMAEDLRQVSAPDITDASGLSANLLDKVLGDASVSLVATEGSRTYYSKAAALKALPEGWSLPTQGELDYAIRKLNGGDYATIGAYLKAPAAGQVDSTSLGLSTHGRYNGHVVDEGTGYLMTRSTKGGVMLAMQMNAAHDGVTVDTLQRCLIPVRGVRAAPSAYSEMMKEFGYTSSRKVKESPARIRLQEDGPLGKFYTMYTKPQAIAYDYTGGQYNMAEAEARSGILYKNLNSTTWVWDARRDANFLSDCGKYGKNKLRKMAAMANGQGTESVVEMQWNRPFRVVTQVVGGKYKRTDTPDVFSPSRNGDGVYITITGDSTDNYMLKNKPHDSDHKGFFINLNAYLKPLSKSILPYFLWDDDHRATETRMDYVQRVFQLLTADFNKDGVDELVIGIDGEVWVYDGATMLKALAEGKVDDGIYKEAPLYHKNFNFKPGTETYKDCSKYYLKKPMTRFAVGDADGDNTPDIVVLQVGEGGDESKAKTELSIYASGNVEADPIATRCLDEYCQKTVFTDVKVGNVSGGQYNDIIMLFRSYEGTSLEKFGRLWRATYNPAESNGQLTIDRRDTYDVGSFRGYDGHIGNTNVTLAHLRGNEYPCDVVVGADMWRWNTESEKLEFKFQVLPFTDDQIWSIYADNIMAADPEGTGRDYLYYFRNWSTYEGGTRAQILGFSETWFSNRTGDISQSTLRHEHSFNSKIFKYCNHGDVWSNDFNKEDELMWWFGNGDAEFGNSAALCAVHNRPGYKQFRYMGHEAAFSEPRIHALIAAPPTYDYGTETEPNYDFVTTWGHRTSSASSAAAGSSISASTMVGFEYEFNAPITGTKLGGVDFTVAMQTECSKSTSQTSSISYSEVYEARDDDRVVMQVTPYDNYTYEVVASDNVDAIGGQLNLSIPQKSMTVPLALTDYDRLMGDAKGVPNLHEVFDHTIGDPFSYPSTPEQIRANVPGDKIMWGKGRWNDFQTTGSGGSSIREIALDESTATTASFSFSVETELVVTAGCAKAGVGFGYGNSNETTHEESQGFTVSACVPGLAPGDRNPARSFFDWNLCWYKYRLNGQTFPVVNYVVKKR